MVKIVEMAVQSRERAGKGVARALRRQNLIPGVIYGDKQSPILISLDRKDFARAMHRPGFFSYILDLKVNGIKQKVIARDVQIHPVSELPLHVDFLRVSEKTPIALNIPVHFINKEESPGLKMGGVLNVVKHDLELLCVISKIPEEIAIDLTGKNIGDSIHFSDITLPEGVESTATEDFTIATLAAPSALKSEEEEAAEAEAEAEEAAAEGEGEEETPAEGEEQ